MSLAFLTPGGTAARELQARSPMERLAVRAGGWLSPLDGWSMPIAYQDAPGERDRLMHTVGFADRSNLSKLELQAEPHVLARIVAQACDGPALEPGLAGRSSVGDRAGTWWCPVTPARVLVLSEPGSAEGARAALARAEQDAAGRVTLVDVTCGLAALSLIGPQARELLARFCAMDLRPAVAPCASFRPGSVARTPGFVLVEAPDRLLVLVGWALGAYLWQVVADAAERLGGGPVGAEALARHTEGADA
jgi:heterotetrameric sarcosine oxidase gamma subunit